MGACVGRSADPVEPPIDRGVLHELRALGADGATDLVAELAGMFLTDTSARLEALRDALSRGDVVELERVAHAIKGSSATIGARVLSARCAELEALARSERGAALEPAVDEVAREFQRTRPALEAELRPPASRPGDPSGGQPGGRR